MHLRLPSEQCAALEAATHPLLADPAGCAHAPGSTTPHRQLNGAALNLVDDDGSLATADQHHLSRVEFNHRLLSLLQLGGFGLDDAGFDDLVHGVLRPVKLCVKFCVPALSNASRCDSDGIRRRPQHLMSATRMPLRRPDYR